MPSVIGASKWTILVPRFLSWCWAAPRRVGPSGSANTFDARDRDEFAREVPSSIFKRCVILVIGLGALAGPMARAQNKSGADNTAAKRHYLTFQIGYRGTASRTVQDEAGRRETEIVVGNLFSGRIEVRPEEVYDIPTNLSEEAMMAKMAAMQAAVMAGDVEQVKAGTPPVVVAWFPVGDQVEITGQISESMTRIANTMGRGESRESQDLLEETYRGQKVFSGNLVNAFVKIHAEEKTYDLQFMLMPDMASTDQAVRQTVRHVHIEEGHNKNETHEENVPLDMGPGQMALNYSNYQMTAEVKGLPLAGEANELMGSTRIRLEKPSGWDGDWDIGLDVSWQIDITLPPVELEISIAGYEAWRPEGNIKESTKPGNNLVARATLKQKEGKGVFNAKVKNIRFQLLDTSREPGVCLNWPLEAKDTDYDLRLAKVAGGTLSKSDQILTVTDPQKNEAGQSYAEAQIDSYDFGGRASLRAICTLTDGREIEGVMKGAGDLPRLPKMKGPGWIADSWRKEKKAEKLADNDDNEDVAGQKEKGDGFTLYEEYRGWVVNGERTEGDTEGKDFFVLNLIGADAEPGIDLFESVSQLRVHGKLLPTEMSEEKRLMNGNRRDGPHRVDQHGVWVKTFASRSELGDDGALTVMNKTGVAGRPGITKGVGILARDNTESAFNKPFNLAAGDATFAFDRAIAHELLHSVGVEHHGTGDNNMIVGYVSARNPMNKLGRPYYGRSYDSPIDLRTEEGEDIAQRDVPEYEKFRKFLDMMQLDNYLKEGAGYIQRNGAGYNENFPTAQAYADFHIELLLVFCFMHLNGIVGVEHGQHSGAEDCLMRYYFAKFYESKKPATMGDKMYYWVTPGSEHIGMEICRDGQGSGVNAAGHKPQSRYGDAAADAGNCFEQICPNDAIPPRKVK